jgi:hypothetical protein
VWVQLLPNKDNERLILPRSRDRANPISASPFSGKPRETARTGDGGRLGPLLAFRHPLASVSCMAIPRLSWTIVGADSGVLVPEE